MRAAPPIADRIAASVVGGALARGKILHGAARLYARKRSTAVTVAEILRTARISRRTFYQHFRNSEQVLEALFELATGLLLDAVREAVLRSQDPWERMDGAVRAYLELQCAVGPLAMVLQSEAIAPGSRLAPRRASVLDRLIEIMSDSVAQAQGRRVEPLVLRAFVLAVEGVCIYLQRSGELSREGVEYVMRVMGPIARRMLAGPEDEVPELPGPQ